MVGLCLAVLSCGDLKLARKLPTHRLMPQPVCLCVCECKSAFDIFELNLFMEPRDLNKFFASMNGKENYHFMVFISQ